MVTAGWSDWQL